MDIHLEEGRTDKPGRTQRKGLQDRPSAEANTATTAPSEDPPRCDMATHMSNPSTGEAEAGEHKNYTSQRVWVNFHVLLKNFVKNHFVPQFPCMTGTEQTANLDPPRELKTSGWGWRHGSAIMITGCSSRGPGISNTYKLAYNHLSL